MPARRPDTSHAVALTDVKTRARLGIEGHSVRAPAVLVKERSGLPALGAGGIRSRADLAAVDRLGGEGAIVGRALLEGRLPLSTLAARG